MTAFEETEMYFTAATCTEIIIGVLHNVLPHGSSTIYMRSYILFICNIYDLCLLIWIFTTTLSSNPYTLQCPIIGKYRVPALIRDD